MRVKRPRRVQETVATGLASIRDGIEVVHLVANAVRGDSRVLKSALVSEEEGFSTLILGIATSEDWEFFEADGIPVILAPVMPAEAGDPRFSADQIAWRRRERAIHAWRVAQSAAERQTRTTASSFRSAVTVPRDPGWAAARPAWLPINIVFAEVLDLICPQLVHVHDTAPLPGAIAHKASERLRGRITSVVYDAHECVPALNESFPDSPFYSAIAMIERNHIHDASGVVTVSVQIARLLRDHYGLGQRPAVVTNGPSGVRDPDAPSLRSTIGLSPETPLAVYSGWVAPDRGLDTVLRALPVLPDLHLGLVVNSPSRELVATLRMARNLDVHDRVHLAPYVPPSQVTQYLASADIGLIPHKSGVHADLSLPTKFREYAHAGLPMVVSDNVTTAAEINRTKIGRVFKAGNVGGLAVQVERVLDSPDRYRDRITDALLREYSWETQADELRKIYRATGTRTEAPAAVGVVESLHRLADGLVEFADTSSTTAQSWGHADVSRFGARIGIGRANSAGQAYQWARAVEQHLEVPAESFAPVNAICHPPHFPVRRSFSIAQGAAEFGRVATDYTYLLIDGFTSLFGSMLLGDLEREIDALRPHMFGIGLIAHGSEIRDPDAHLERVDGSYFAQAPENWVESLRTISRNNRGIAARFDGPLFASTPDLIDDLPRAHWLPVIVDTERWSPIPPPPLTRKLRVLHQPSRQDPPVKGTDVINPVLERLEAAGAIEYLHGEGLVDQSEMPDLISRCDVVVDQIRTGSYGVAAVEAMMAGRIVVGNVSQSVRDVIDSELPIVDAPPSDFEDAMLRLIESDRADLEARSAAGRAFASEHHDGRRAAEVISNILLDPPSTKAGPS